VIDFVGEPAPVLRLAANVALEAHAQIVTEAGEVRLES
jgi:hypothetical protein